MTFRVGQKVVCVDDRDGDILSPYGSGHSHGLRKGSVYEITSISASGKFLRLAGVRDGWLKERFRPVVERKTDISFAHEILRKASKPARGPAVASPERATP